MMLVKLWVVLMALMHVSSWDMLTMEKDISFFIKEESEINCDDFFHGTPWPLPVGSDKLGVVRLCQDQVKDRQVGDVVFATLFSTTDRIPLYTANTVMLVPGKKEYKRPSSENWHRVSYGLCNLNELPSSPIQSEIKYVSQHLLSKCAKYQAVWTDYEDNGMDLDRGHLSPNSINSQSKVKQLGTFTLTNAAPQFAKFNEHLWWDYECVTQYTILDLVPSEQVFVITGTYGTALDQQGNPLWMNADGEQGKNPVRVPGYYWKAVCYPGNESNGKLPWGYAVVQKNEDILVKPDFRSYITLKEFSQKYFEDPPFGSSCINASFGDFQQYLNPATFEKLLEDHCNFNDQRFE